VRCCLTIARLIPVLALSIAAAAFAADDHAAYADRGGEKVGVFDQSVLNYRLDLDDHSYSFVDFTDTFPEASFAAVDDESGVISIVIVDDLGVEFTAREYAEWVRSSVSERLVSTGNSGSVDFREIGATEVDGVQAYQLVLLGGVGSTDGISIVSSLVDRTRAYLVLTLAINLPEAEVVDAASTFLSSFSILDPDASVGAVARVRSVNDYTSKTFAYRFRTNSDDWLPWTDLEDYFVAADLGTLSSEGYGAVVLPVCWNGPRPNDSAIYTLMMEEFIETFSADTFDEQTDFSKAGLSGRQFIWRQSNDGDEYRYYVWVTANESCAYALGAWGLASEKKARKRIERLWRDFEILQNPGAVAGNYRGIAEKSGNAYLLNSLAFHYFEARSFRDSFRLFSDAANLAPGDATFLTNSLRSLVEIDAYKEAAEFLAPRLPLFPDEQNIHSWDAWLAYQTGQLEKASEIYRALFENDFRSDEDFAVYMNLLADGKRWDELDRVFDAYTAAGGSDKTRILKAQLLARRGEFDEALAIIDEISAGRPFDADIVYERINILYDMGNPAEILRLADLLIDNGYRSLQSYYFKGDAEYQLRWYMKARDSFEKAQSYSPSNPDVQQYLDAIDRMLGEGDNASISASIAAVPLPAELRVVFDANDSRDSDAGYGAYYINRIVGFHYDSGNSVRQTHYRKIRIVDDNGIAQFSTLEFDFDPGAEQMYVDRVIVRDAEGKQIAQGEPNSYYITNSENSYEASNEKTVHIPVPSLAPGVVIEAVITKSSNVETGEFPLEFVYLATDRPIAFSAVFVSGNHEQLQFQTNDVVEPRQSEQSLIWEAGNPAVFRWEPLQPYFDQILPWVYLGTTSKDWETAGNNYLEEIQDKLDVSMVAERAQQLIQGVDDTQRKIEILSGYVQNQIHYEAIEFGRRAYIPKTARETLRDLYGDCKDHSVLLHAMLSAVEIPSSLALVNLSQQILPGLPNVDQFDHMIVSVPTPDGLLFIDATDKDLRLGQLSPRSMAGNFALVLDDDPALLKIPDYDPNLVGLTIERVVEPIGAGQLQVTETGRFSGYQAAELRGQLREIETSEMQAALQRWLAVRYSSAEVTDHFVENVQDANYDLIVELQYVLPLESDGTFDLPGFLETYYLEFGRVADRRFPFEHQFPLQLSAVTSIKVPEGRRLDLMSKKPDADESRFGNWQRQVSQEAGNWEIRLNYKGSETRFNASDYRAFAEFHRKLVDAIEQPLVLE
jgi:transglutaminase-like putative cysteine protease